MAVNVYAVLGPVVLGLVVIEFFYCLYKKNGYYTFQDSMSSLGTMIGAQCVNLFVAFLVLRGFQWVFEHFTLFTFEKNFSSYALCFLGVDFFFYWFHRAGHSINFLWAANMPHHSTEELNYAVALRASLTQRLMSFLFYWPLVVIGFSPEMLVEVVAFHLVLQFVPHTRVVPKLPKWVESWMNTPSHHRVHHGLNKQYINKNYGGFLIIWDKLFGTWEEEVEEVFYGVTRPTRSWDPTLINIQWWRYLWEDMRSTPRLYDKIKTWLGPIGWRPPGAPEREKMPVWTKETQVKYKSEPFEKSYPYIFFQLILALGLMFFVIYDQSPMGGWEKTIASIILWIQATVWSGLMEKKSWTFIVESARILLSGTFLVACLDAYGLDKYIFAVVAIHAVSFMWMYVLKTTNSAKETVQVGA